MLSPSISFLPPRNFTEVTKKWLVGSALRLGLKDYFKAIIDNLARNLGPE